MLLCKMCMGFKPISIAGLSKNDAALWKLLYPCLDY